MNIGKSNRTKELVKELDEIEYILDNNRLEPIKRRFYEHRYTLIETLVNDYLNSNTHENLSNTKAN